MTHSTTPRRLFFSGKQQVHLEEFPLPEPEPGEVRIRSQYSLMSTGTENIVFNRLFAPDTHWDKWVSYPFYPGYSAVGIVETPGETLKPGQAVVYRGRHTSHANVAESKCLPLPEGLPLREAPWFALAKIAFHGIKVSGCALGEDILIVGAGPIGQMTLRWANAAGARRISVVDTYPERLALAKKGGATTVISAPVAEAREAIMAAHGGKLPRIAIDTTGNAQVFSAVLGLVENFGTVVVLGDTGTPANQSLTLDVITRGITIVGAHDCHNTPEWNDRTITELFFALVESHRFSLEGLNTHVFMPEDCVDAYGVANRERAKTMGILFDWTA